MEKVQMFFLLITTLFFSHPTAWAETGDRAVLSINIVTYTQRQVEMYIGIKESLRRNTAIDSSRVVTAGNWAEALTVFTEDMIIYQESQRLGGLQPPDSLIDKFVNLVREKNKRSEVFRATMERLGAGQTEIVKVLDMVIRTAAFRRSKDRAGQNTSVTEIDDTTETRSPWLTELIDRSIQRRYENAHIFKDINPSQGSAAVGK